MVGGRAWTLTTEAKIRVAGHRRIAIPIARWRGHGVVVDREKVILIEGFPRSANSFAVAAFDFAQDWHPDVAHHLHAAGHVLEAIRLGVPAIVLVRDPNDAVPELVIAHPRVSLRQGFRSYLAFYRRLMPHHYGFVVAAFPEVTTDFGAVIRRVNMRFGSSFTGSSMTTGTRVRCSMPWMPTGVDALDLERSSSEGLGVLPTCASG